MSRIFCRRRKGLFDIDVGLMRDRGFRQCQVGPWRGQNVLNVRVHRAHHDLEVGEDPLGSRLTGTFSREFPVGVA